MLIDPKSGVVSQPLRKLSHEPLVLVVEDHPTRRLTWTVCSFSNGYSVIGTDHGRDAARQAREIRPDLLLVDLDVPCCTSWSPPTDRKAVPVVAASGRDCHA